MRSLATDFALCPGLPGRLRKRVYKGQVSETEDKPMRLGISACLLGAPVRFDGGHKRDRYLQDVLGRYVEWVPVCPEVGSGMGTPRETLRLVGSSSSAQPRLMTGKTGVDHTDIMLAFADKELKKLDGKELCGFVLKSKSPSCGMERVKVYSSVGMPDKGGVGVFARALMAAMPLLPVEEEGRLHDPNLREGFLECVFAYRRWRTFRNGEVSRGSLVAFHSAHKFFILAHSPNHYQELGHLVAAVKEKGLAHTVNAYGTLFMTAIRERSTVRTHTNVLQHMAGFFKKEIPSAARTELSEVIKDYRKGLVPLVVPLTLVRHYVRALEVQYLRDQVYLEPTPKELMLRNHV